MKISLQTVRQMNWLGLSNGKLLSAVAPHFQVFVTVDKNLVQQQNLTGLQIAVVIIRAPSNKIEDLSPLFRRFLLCCWGLGKGSSLLSAELK